MCSSQGKINLHRKKACILARVFFHCRKPQQDVHFKMSVVLLPSSVSEC